MRPMAALPALIQDGVQCWGGMCLERLVLTLQSLMLTSYSQTLEGIAKTWEETSLDITPYKDKGHHKLRWETRGSKRSNVKRSQSHNHSQVLNKQNVKKMIVRIQRSEVAEILAWRPIHTMLMQLQQEHKHFFFPPGFYLISKDFSCHVIPLRNKLKISTLAQDLNILCAQ